MNNGVSSAHAKAWQFPYHAYYEINGCLDYGDFMSKTGWKPILTHEMKSYKICPECYEKLNYHAKEIIKMINDKNLFFPDLLKE